MRSLVHPSRACALALSLVLCALVAPAHAEDIDIYADPNAANDVPNVLFVLDNSANWSSSIPAANCFYKNGGVVTADGPKASNPGQEQGKKMAIEKCALYNLVDALPVATSGGPDNDALFKIGFMLLNESPDNGAYPRKAFTALTTNNKAVLKALIKGLAISDDKGSNSDFAKAMYEAYLYFKGLRPYQGDARAQARRQRHQRRPLQQPCRRVMLAQLRDLHRQRLARELREQQLARPADRRGRQHVAALVSDVDRQEHRPGQLDGRVRALPAQRRRQHQRRLAGHHHPHGGGDRRLVGRPLSELHRRRSPTRAAARSTAPATPTSCSRRCSRCSTRSRRSTASSPRPACRSRVNARGTYLNQVYMGMFRPDGQAKPRWRGNLKQYQFGLRRPRQAVAGRLPRARQR